MKRAFAQSKLAANVTEEQDWYLDTPDVRLTRIFTVVLILHVVAVGGILAFKMIDKASENSGMQLASSRTSPGAVVKQQSALAAKIPQNQKVANPTSDSLAAAERSAATSNSSEKKTKVTAAGPLVKDPAKANQYRVLAGDTLSEIAKTLGIDSADLRKVNAIRSDSELYPGRWLDIPEKEEVPAINKGSSGRAEPNQRPSDKVIAEKKAVGSSAGQRYEVISGDTAWGISRQFGVTYQALVGANAEVDLQSLRIGQKLNVPAK